MRDRPGQLCGARASALEEVDRDAGVEGERLVRRPLQYSTAARSPGRAESELAGDLQPSGVAD